MQRLRRAPGQLTGIIAVLVAVLGIAIPLLIALLLAYHQGQETEMQQVSTYARDVLHRADSTIDQGYTAINTLVAQHSADPCSDASLALMRRLNLESSYLQAVGYVVNDHMVCSSQGREGVDFALGPVDWVSLRHVRIRLSVRFPFDDANTYIVIERNGFAAIMNRDLALDATTSEKDVSLGFFQPTNGKFMALRGYVKPEWTGLPTDQLPSESSVRAFVDAGYVVAVARSDRRPLAAVAALPVTYMRAQVRSTALILVPVGLVAGVALALAALHLVQRQTALPAMIRAGLRRKEFYMVYQPVVDLRSGEWVGAEALLRWRRANGELMRPDLFIPVAEDAGLIRDITHRVVELVTQDLKGVFAVAPRFHLAINVSTMDLESGDVLELMGGMTHRMKAGPGNLVIEVTERGLLNRDLAQGVLSNLRDGGVRVAIDDFGTGYSTLAYLENFKIDYLKIDKSFVDTMNLATPTSQVALHIIGMARSLKIELIAEGVENEGQATLLCDLGVQYAQGWHLSRPMLAEDLLQGLRQAQIRKPELVPLAS